MDAHEFAAAGPGGRRRLAALLAEKLHLQQRALEELRLQSARMETTLTHLAAKMDALCADLAQMRSEQRAQDVGIAALEARARLWGGVFGALLGAAAALAARLLP
jgi:hypothetical protein